MTTSDPQGGKVLDSVGDPVPAPLAWVFDSLSSAGISWCLLGRDEDLAAPDGDVDLLVAAHHRQRVRDILVQGGFLQLAALGRGSHRFFVGYDRSRDAWTRLDVVHDLRFGRYQSMRWSDGAECLARRQRVGQIFVPSPTDAFWALLLHCLLDEGEVADRHRCPLQRLAASALTDEHANGPLFGPAAPVGWDPASLVRGVREGDWLGLERLAPHLAKDLKRAHRLRAATEGATNRGLRALTKVALFRHKGLTVAFLGPDGSGKSTLAAALADRYFQPVRIVYMGIHLRAARGRASRPVPLLARLPVNWMRCLSAALHVMRSRLVIFDRYPFDALLPSARPIGRLRSAGRWMVAHACPRPDVVVLLDAPGDLMHRRKPEHSIDVLDRRREQYLELASRLGFLHVVDATQPLGDVRRHVTALIWDVHRRRRHASGQARMASRP